MNLKLNFQISIPHNLDIYGGNISLIDSKIIGLIWIACGYISNGYEFDNFPNGIVIQ